MIIVLKRLRFGAFCLEEKIYAYHRASYQKCHLL